MTAPSRTPLPSPDSEAEEVLADARYGIPPLHRSYVSRPRLLAALSAGAERPLVLVSAPAGTGKTMLVAEWVRRAVEASASVGWVTFEEDDVVFWPYVVECLRRLGVSTPRVRVKAESPTGRANMIALAAAIVDGRRRITLVLDGYELVSLTVARELDFLLRHTAGLLQVVLVGRVDPVLRLYRYRLDEDLVEIRAADLALTEVEAARVVSRFGVTLSADSTRLLNLRTHGWLVGVVFSARALASAASHEKALDAVLDHCGDLNEYLVGEVLDVQTPEVRHFLLATSVTEIVSAGLVEELLGPESVSTFWTLARAGTFIEPVADRPRVYRYFPFFRDLLRARLDLEAPHEVTELHRRAARWYRREGALETSVRHLVQAGAWDQLACDLVEDLSLARLLLEGSDGMLRGAVQELPGSLDSAEAGLLRAAGALASGDAHTCAEELSRSRAAAGDRAAEGALSLAILVVDAARASMFDEASRAAQLAAAADRELRAGRVRAGRCSTDEVATVVGAARGLAMLRAGRHADACDVLSVAASTTPAAEHASFRARCLGLLSVARALNGELREAHRSAGLALSAAAETGTGVSASFARIALARAALEQGDQNAARRWVAYVTPPVGVTVGAMSHGLVETVRAALDRMSGDAEGASARLVETAGQILPSDPWLAARLRQEAARIEVAEGRAERALQALGADPDSYLDPCAAVVAAAAHAELQEDALVAQLLGAAPAEALPLQDQVSRLLVEALQASRTGVHAKARSLLEAAVTLAAPEDLRRPFLDAGPAVARLLEQHPNLLVQRDWLTRPGDAADGVVPTPYGVGAHVARPVAVHTTAVERLTPRELVVLGYLQQLLTTEEIAEEMFVSVNTVRTHVRNVLRKLGVNRRNHAVRRARELGLVPPEPMLIRSG